MIWVVIAEALLLVVLGVFVLALIHCYAGLVAKVEDGSLATTRRGADRTPPQRSAAASAPASQVTGVTPLGDGVVLPLVGVDHDTMLAFLTSTCTSCQRLWSELVDADGSVLPSPLRLVVVPKGPDQESPAAILAAAPDSVDVVMSSVAWSDFNVPGSPYFVLVDGASGLVRGEGTALSWQRVVDLAAVATGDDRLADGIAHDPRKPTGDLRREAEVDRLLLDAGILPGDPSLYPGQEGVEAP